MINPNYNFVEPLANQSVDNVAKGVPHPVVNRNILREINDNHNLSPYNRENSELLKKKIYSPKLAPSSGISTEAFLKSRELFSPMYFHNESATKYLMISSMNITSKQQKNSIDFRI
tara:strand:- start:640 stop:987 length:348 start_codon:yes stop_codon:yes gene_type:complete